MDTVRVGIVGLGFGAEFIPIYQQYKGAECVAVCRRNEAKLNEMADRFHIPKRYTDYREMLKDDEIDAIHINTDFPEHAWMTIEALKAGKHVACTINMAMTVDECKEIVRLEKETGKVYMMMETAVYTREFLYFKKLYEEGQVGRIQFMRSSHVQNMGMPGWDDYWHGMPPMFNGTHALSPLSAAIGKPYKTVRCLGSGKIREEYEKNYGSPFVVESAAYTFEDSDVTCEVTRSLFDVIRQYRESFDIYGTEMSFEWEQLAGENPVIFTGFEDAKRVEAPDTDDMLPREIGSFALRNRIVDDSHVSFIQGDGHGGSHPHLVHEFVSAIREGRLSAVNARVAANWTMAGLLAHESAMRGGVEVEIPHL